MGSGDLGYKMTVDTKFTKGSSMGGHNIGSRPQCDKQYGDPTPDCLLLFIGNSGQLLSRVGLDYSFNLGSTNWIPPLCQPSAGM